MPRMPGVQLIDPDVWRTLGAADRSGIASAMGTTLAQMHTLVWPYAGEYDLETNTIQPLSIGFIRCLLLVIPRIASDMHDYGGAMTCTGVRLHSVVEQAGCVWPSPSRP